MAGRQGHLIHLARVPSRHNQAAAVRRAFDHLNQIRNLINRSNRHGAICATRNLWEMSPLVAVNRAKIALFIGPFIPDGNAIFFEIANIRIAREEP